jgi:hypothetical protein
VDLIHILSTFNGQPPDEFQVLPSPITSLTFVSPNVSAESAGRIAYLYNHYGINTITSNEQAGALAVAIWALEYDGPNLYQSDGVTPITFTPADFGSASNFPFQIVDLVPGSSDTTLIKLETDAANFINESGNVGTSSPPHNETATFLDPTLGGTKNPPLTGDQGMIAPGSFNFALTSKATPSINTSQQPASAVVGSSIADKATVSGLVNASSSDTVTFNL